MVHSESSPGAGGATVDVPELRPRLPQARFTCAKMPNFILPVGAAQTLPLWAQEAAVLLGE